MSEKKCKCYLTYVFETDNIPEIPAFSHQADAFHAPPFPEGRLPDGFMPEWFISGKFPEDE